MELVIVVGTVKVLELLGRECPGASQKRGEWLGKETDEGSVELGKPPKE